MKNKKLLVSLMSLSLLLGGLFAFLPKNNVEVLAATKTSDMYTLIDYTRPFYNGCGEVEFPYIGSSSCKDQVVRGAQLTLNNVEDGCGVILPQKLNDAGTSDKYLGKVYYSFSPTTLNPDSGTMIGVALGATKTHASGQTISNNNIFFGFGKTSFHERCGFYIQKNVNGVKSIITFEPITFASIYYYFAVNVFKTTNGFLYDYTFVNGGTSTSNEIEITDVDPTGFPSFCAYRGANETGSGHTNGFFGDMSLNTYQKSEIVSDASSLADNDVIFLGANKYSKYMGVYPETSKGRSIPATQIECYSDMSFDGAFVVKKKTGGYYNLLAYGDRSKALGLGQSLSQSNVGSFVVGDLTDSNILYDFKIDSDTATSTHRLYIRGTWAASSTYVCSLVYDPNASGTYPLSFASSNDFVSPDNYEAMLSIFKYKVSNVVKTFVNDNMHMTDYTESKMYCLNSSSQHYYKTAKDALININDADFNAEFKRNSDFAAANERYETWARINKDSKPYEDDNSYLNSNVIQFNNNDDKTLILVISISVLALASFLIIKKKKITVK